MSKKRKHNVKGTAHKGYYESPTFQLFFCCKLHAKLLQNFQISRVSMVINVPRKNNLIFYRSWCGKILSITILSGLVIAHIIEEKKYIHAFLPQAYQCITSSQNASKVKSSAHSNFLKTDYMNSKRYLCKHLWYL